MRRPAPRSIGGSVGREGTRCAQRGGRINAFRVGTVVTREIGRRPDTDRQSFLSATATIKESSCIFDNIYFLLICVFTGSSLCSTSSKIYVLSLRQRQRLVQLPRCPRLAHSSSTSSSCALSSSMPCTSTRLASRAEACLSSSRVAGRSSTTNASVMPELM